MTDATAKPASNRSVGRGIFTEALKALSKDKSVLLAPLFGFFAQVIILGVAVAAGVALIPLVTLPNGDQVVSTTAGVIAVIGLAIVQVVVQAIVMVNANERYEGRDPKVSESFASAMNVGWQVVLFGLIEGTVGLIIRALRDVRGVGQLLSLLGGLAWGIATYFSLPFILFEGSKAGGSIRQSTQLVRSTWAGAARVNVVAGGAILLGWLVSIGLFGGGLALWVAGLANSSSTVFPIALAAVGLVAILLMMLIQSAVMSYVRVALFRFAKQMPLDGFETANLSAAFARKRVGLI